MNRRDFLQTLSVALPTAAVTAAATRPSTYTLTTKDSAERILDTRKMRCSYVVYPPAIMKDPNTGKLSGMFYDLTQKLGEIADIEMEWVGETTYGTLPTDLQQQKFDLFAGGLWPRADQAKAINFSLPAFYSGLGIYVRSDDHRFDGNPAKLNAPNYRIATIDGEMSQVVQQSDFAKTSVLSLPDTSDQTMLAESVATRKADATMLETAVANLYLQQNPGKLRSLTKTQPIRIYENTWGFDHRDQRIKAVMDTAVKEMLYSGFVDKVLADYQQLDNFYRVRSPIA